MPTQIATLICQHVKGQELPRVDCVRLGGGSLEQALKARAAEVGIRVSATLAAATPHFAPFRRASPEIAPDRPRSPEIARGYYAAPFLPLPAHLGQEYP